MEVQNMKEDKKKLKQKLKEWKAYAKDLEKENEELCKKIRKLQNIK